MRMRERNQIREAIQIGKTILGIELGSTRIKAVLIDEDNIPDCGGQFSSGKTSMWIISGPIPWRMYGKAFRAATGILPENVEKEYGVKLDPACGSRDKRHDARLSGV